MQNNSQRQSVLNPRVCNGLLSLIVCLCHFVAFICLVEVPLDALRGQSTYNSRVQKGLVSKAQQACVGSEKDAGIARNLSESDDFLGCSGQLWFRRVCYHFELNVWHQTNSIRWTTVYWRLCAGKSPVLQSLR